MSSAFFGHKREPKAGRTCGPVSDLELELLVAPCPLEEIGPLQQTILCLFGGPTPLQTTAVNSRTVSNQTVAKSQGMVARFEKTFDLDWSHT